MDDGLSILRKNGRHKDTNLTVGEFAQPVVARTLIELQANIEKGLCQRFLWVVPKPVAIPLDELQQVDREFSTAIGKKAPLCVLVDASLYLMLRHDYNHTSFMCNASHTVGLMSSLWKPNHSIMILPRPIETFRQRHASILQQITTVSCMDLLCGE